MRQALHAAYALDLRQDAAERDGDRVLAAALSTARRASLGNAATAVTVEANHGRWVVECPDCRGAQLAHPGERRFMCDECLNVAVDGKWRPVIWPKDPDAIERELHRRPVDRQHWLPGETVTDLRAQFAAASQLEHISSDAYREQFNDHKAPHTHPWPKRLPKSETVECPECGLILPTALVRADDANGSR